MWVFRLGTGINVIRDCAYWGDWFNITIEGETDTFFDDGTGVSVYAVLLDALSTCNNTPAGEFIFEWNNNGIWQPLCSWLVDSYLGYVYRSCTITNGAGYQFRVRLGDYTKTFTIAPLMSVCTQEFIVKDEVGNPLYGAMVKGDWSPYPILCTTGLDGKCSAELDLEPGYNVYYSVFAEKSGYDCLDNCKKTFLACQPNPIELILTQQPEYCYQQVALKDENGNWLGGVTLTVVETGDRTITFGYDHGDGYNGSVYCPVYGEIYRVRASGTGYTTDEKSFVACDYTVPISLQVEKLGDLCDQRVQVVRQNGTVVDHAEVTVWSDEYGDTQTKLTDSNGIVLFPLVINTEYHVRACISHGTECVEDIISSACVATLVICPDCEEIPPCVYTGHEHDAKIDHYSVPESATIGKSVHMSVSVDNTALINENTTYYVEYTHSWDSLVFNSDEFQLDAIGEYSITHDFIMPNQESVTVTAKIYRCTSTGWSVCPNVDAVKSFTITAEDEKDIKMLVLYTGAAVGIYAVGSFLPGKAGKVVPVVAVIPAGLAAYEGYKLIKGYI